MSADQVKLDDVRIEAPAIAHRKLRVLAVATEWFSGKGGISTINREICVRLARLGHKVVCLIPHVSDADAALASGYGVSLIGPTPSPDRGAVRISGGEVDMRDLLYTCPKMPAEFEPDIIIGHGRITGPAAKWLQENCFSSARRVQFIHVAPGEIEWFKDREEDHAARVDRRQGEERELAAGASLVVAIGPRLEGEIRSSLAALTSEPPVFRLDPGLSPILAGRRIPPGFHCLFLGRAEDTEAKGVDIAAAALNKFIIDCGDYYTGPVIFAVRGVEEGTAESLRQELLKICPSPRIHIRPYNFTSDQAAVEGDILRSCLMLMPSRGEGFGLVGLEAINSGTPVLISRQSGLADLLMDLVTPTSKLRGIVVETPPGDPASAVGNWAFEIDGVFRDKESAFRKVAALHALLEPLLCWDSAIEALVEQFHQYC